MDYLTKNQSKLSIVVAVFSALLFVTLSMQHAFVLTAPSDPLQYVLPALNPEGGFPYFDRTTLWLWLRFVSIIPMPLEYVGGVATLIVTTMILLLSTYWLSQRFSILAGAIFASLYIASPMVLGISTYTYPMQLMTLVILITLLILDHYQGKGKYFVGGMGGGIAILSKVQGISFLGYLMLLALFSGDNRLRKIGLTVVGILSGIVFIFLIVAVLDGFGQVQSLFNQYFNSKVASGQYAGRAQGGMPEFYQYLKEPVCILAGLGMVLPWLSDKLKNLRPFATVAALQFFGLVAVYFLTQRGGPLIHNYSFDAMVIGLIAFSGAAAYLFREVKYKLLTSFFLILTSFIAVQVYAHIGTPSVTLYRPSAAWGQPISTSLAVMTWLGGVLLVIQFAKKRFLSTRVLIIISILLLLSVVGRAGYGVKEGMFRVQWSEPYHWLAQQIKTLDPDSVWVSVKVNVNSVVSGSLRSKEVYETFYENGDQKDRVVRFHQNNTMDTRYIVTDVAKVLIENANLAYEDRTDLEKLEGMTIKASEVNAGSRVPFRTVMMKNDALIKINNKNMSVVPFGSSDGVTLQMHFPVQPKVMSLVKDSMIVFSVLVDKINVPVRSSAYLFIQYQDKTKVTRKFLKLEGEKSKESFFMNIPHGASQLSYGWILQNTSAVLNLPTIKTFSAILEGRGSPFAFIDTKDKSVRFLASEGKHYNNAK